MNFSFKNKSIGKEKNPSDNLCLSKKTKFVRSDSRDDRAGKKWWAVAESNCGHEAFQASALPTELTAHDF